VLSLSNNVLWDGIVACECHQFPVTSGILNLGGADKICLREAVRHLSAGRIKSAILVQIEVERLRISNTAKFLRNLSKLNILGIKGIKHLGEPWPLLPKATPPRTDGVLKNLINRFISHYRTISSRPFIERPTFCSAMDSLQAGEFGIYLENRFAHPSLLSTLPLIMLLPHLHAKRILDLGCGAGHLAFLMNCYVPAAELTCVDKFYTLLYLARKFLAPSARLICLDLQFPLPVLGHFDVVFSSDMFHYLKQKEYTTSECLRVLAPSGYLIICHLHNSLASNITPGHPLSPSQWSHLFANIPHRLYSEESILTDFVQNGKIDLNMVPGERQLEASPAITLVGSFTKDISSIFLKNLFSIMKSKTEKTNWVLNPLYKYSFTKNRISQYDLVWPSKKLRIECNQLEELMPSTVFVPVDICEYHKTDTFEAEFYRLIKQFTILPYPTNYFKVRTKKGKCREAISKPI
jgi:SAM-dependent methyltransferase